MRKALCLSLLMATAACSQGGDEAYAPAGEGNMVAMDAAVRVGDQGDARHRRRHCREVALIGNGHRTGEAVGLAVGADAIRYEIRARRTRSTSMEAEVEVVVVMGSQRYERRPVTRSPPARPAAASPRRGRPRAGPRRPAPGTARSR